MPALLARLFNKLAAALYSSCFILFLSLSPIHTAALGLSFIDGFFGSFGIASFITSFCNTE
jgi:hypothetical protein